MKDGGREGDTGANVASFLQAASAQTGLMALAEGKTEGTTGKTLTQEGKNLKGVSVAISAVWLISLNTDLFYNVPDHFPLGMLSSCDLSQCLYMCVIKAPLKSA